MKKSMWTRLLVLALVLAMLVPTASAAPLPAEREGQTLGWFQSIRDNLRDWGETIRLGRREPKLQETVPQLRLMEGRDTVENGEMLRAESYEVKGPAGKDSRAGDSIKYFSATLYDYDERINQAVRRVDHRERVGERNLWTGIYFKKGGSGGIAPGVSGEAQNYGQYNAWTGPSGRIYSGIVQDTLGPGGEIRFNYPEGGIFTEDDSVKDIYTNVGIPYEYDERTRYYTFDASQFGAYFEGGAESSKNLTYHSQPQHNEGGGPGYYPSGNGWYPFNERQQLTAQEGLRNSANYHFGMKTTIPFSMTANGRIDPANDRSAPIKFSFAGDDDVWVFIDGHLVLDLGGIHDSINGEVDFAKNTWTIEPTKDRAAGGDAAGRLPNQRVITGQLFDEDPGKSQIPMDRATFAATEDHELTVFYLERGEGASNCKIEFNLPLLDGVSVYKQVNQAWTSTGSGQGTVRNLTAEEQQVIDNIDFGFTLYKKSEGAFQPVSNTKYCLMNADGQVVAIPATDADGHFTLRNGQSARFTGGISVDGDTYYVAEDNMNSYGFVAPDYLFGGNAAGGFAVDGRHYGSAGEIPRQVLLNQEDGTVYDSHAVTVWGGSESKDTLVFLCRNYVDATLPETTAKPVDDKFVLDYGLGAKFDVLRNDLYKGDSLEIIAVGGSDLTVDETGHVDYGAAPRFGQAHVENGEIRYEMTKPLTDVEVLTYAVRSSSTTHSVIGGTVRTDVYGTAKVYVIPATTMYYEEDFGLVDLGGGNPWDSVGRSETDLQEPGMVGTVGDSVYGSDAAYIHDGGDSNGASLHVNTAQKPAAFRYTFTGTETSFFARTANTSAEMRVRITDESGQRIYESFRNTVYKDDTSAVSGPLYNIPVFTWNAGEKGYGTYTVTVSIAKADSTMDRYADFWLDGVRVVNPMNPDSPLAGVAQSAYAADGEANMTHATVRRKLLTEANRDPQTGEPVWDSEGQNFVLFTDKNGQMRTAAEYESFGPKEELYLYDGQSITFSLKHWDANTNMVFLGMKAPTGSAEVEVGSRTLALDNAADCYVDISRLGRITQAPDGSRNITFTIRAGADQLVSLTNIKVTGSAEFTIVDAGA